MSRLLCLLVALAALPSAHAQPHAFGSAFDPLEIASASFSRPTGVVAGYVGPAFLGQSWQTIAALEAEGRVGRLSVGLGGTLHTGTGGFYEPETDELYDLARLLRYARLDARPGFPVYARAGPTQQMTLGNGHLVRDYRSTTAWDERTVGAEAAIMSTGVTAGGFLGDLRANSVVGGFAEIHPAPNARAPALRALKLGLSGVHDFALPSEEAPTGFQLEVSTEAYRLAELAVSPFVSYAEYLNYGRGYGVGADLASSAAIDAARARIRLAVFVNEAGFLPGYVGPFYQIDNLQNRIVTADSFFDDETATELVGVPLNEIERGVDVLTEIELAAFRSFVLLYHFRRHYGDQRLSEFSFRLAFRPRSLDGLRVVLEIERQGLGSFFSLFNTDLRDQNTLVFDIDYPVSDLLHLSIRSRYGYRLLPDDRDEGARFLVQRRFEPLAGLRLRF